MHHEPYTTEKFVRLSRQAAAAAGKACDDETRLTFEILAAQWKSLAELQMRLAKSRAQLGASLK